MARRNRAKQARALLYGLGLLAVLFVVTAWVSVPRMESDLSGRSAAALADHGFRHATVTADGRRVTIAGARSEADALAMDSVVRRVRGVARTRVPGPGGGRGDPSVGPGAPALEAALEAGTITLRGQVPARGLEAGLLEASAVAYGADRVVDELVVTEAEPDDGAASDVAALGVLLGELPARLRSGLVALGDRQLEVAGLLGDDATRADIDAALAAAQGRSPGLSVLNSVREPLVTTTTAAAQAAAFTVEVADGWVALMGNAGTTADAELLLEAANRAFGARLTNGLTATGDGPARTGTAALAELITSLQPSLQLGRLEVAGARLVVTGIARDAAVKAALDAALAGITTAGMTVEGGFDAPAPPGGEDRGTQFVEDRLNQLVQAQPITFGSASAAIAAASAATLDQIATVVGATTGMVVTIEGHTDSSGNANLNQTLSQQRADAVRAALLGRGLPDGVLQAVGYGDSRPRADNATEASRQENRRVQFDVHRGGG